MLFRVGSLLMCLFGASLIFAEDKPFSPLIAKANDEGQKAIPRFQLPEGFQAELVAAEPMLANPIAFCIDEKGRFFVAETFRLHDGVSDNRNHMDWLVHDIASMTIEDRIKYHREKLGEQFAKWSTEHDRVRLVWDADGDGKADHDSVFSDGYHRLEDGLGSGVLAFNGNVYFTCIPDLWLLRDDDNDGKAEIKKSLQTGYGIRTSFIGHDLHGLIMGPDGKLYFSIGDRGLNVNTPAGPIVATECGSVVRCNQDGSDLELYHTGLRNPQELAFDAFGNLFTGDNNSDSGDRARLVPIVEGGDSGWRMPFQYVERPTPRGPWNEDKLWTPRHETQPAYIVPPILNFADGPSGLAYNPGIGLPDKFQNHFLLADFRGGVAISGIRHFRLEPDGASFKVADDGIFAWRLVATDVDFGYDGCIYALDWVEGWNKPNKGRIYRLFQPEQRSAGADVAKLVADGIDKLPPDRLMELLTHRDFRVRLRAQWALADRGAESLSSLTQMAAKGPSLFARLHGIWGIGQIERKSPGSALALIFLMNDPDPAIRGQAAKTLGEVKFAPAQEALTKLLADENARVQFLAATALGRLGKPESAEPLFALAERNNDRDVYVRHAVVYAVSLLNNTEAVKAATKEDRSFAVRRAALLVLRRWKSADLQAFLAETSATAIPLVEEAARAVYDLPIDPAYPALSTLLARKDLSIGVRRRGLNAHFRLGRPEDAQALANLAGDGREKVELRLEALDLLAHWSKPPALDTYHGGYRPLPERSPDVAANEFARVAGALLASPDKAVRERAIELIALLQSKSLEGQLVELFRDLKEPAGVRSESLRSLGSLKAKDLAQLVQEGLRDSKQSVRVEARKLLTSLDPASALPILNDVIASSAVAEKQEAIRSLGTLASPSADESLVNLLDQLAEGKLPIAVRLDVRQAASSRESSIVKKKLAQTEAKRASITDLVDRFGDALEGGTAKEGSKIFFEKGAVACLKCHKMGDRGGEVGPDLSKIAEKNDKRALLEAIVDPNRKISQGFDSVVLALADGRSLTGVLREETDDQVVLYDADAKRWVIPKSEIEERQRSKSAMPEDIITKLTESELRDLVEYLSTRK
ncbi:HEAT repeat domain-containing protein [bacterium]|nr:HEAT repeat domain-containing protein [bacterium]